MVAIKPADADTFVARPNPAQPIVLIYGGDAGLVRERAEKIARSAVKDPDDPFAMVHLEGDALASDPSRLVEEAHTIPLFGGKRAVWVKPTSRNISSAVEALIAAPPVDCRVVIEAGDLRRTSPIRTMCEKSKAAAAIACYVDNERDLARLVDEEMREAKLAIAPDAKAALVALIGGDRRASRSEIRKLALYAHGRGKVDIDDVMAVVADASGLALDDVIDAAFAGKIADAETNFSKAIADGTAPGTIMFAAVRQVMQLHKARLALENGDSTDEALRVFIPPVHFRRKSLVEAALRNWSSARLGKLMEQLAEAALNVRRTPGLSDALAQRALLSIAMAARSPAIPPPTMRKSVDVVTNASNVILTGRPRSGGPGRRHPQVWINHFGSRSRRRPAPIRSSSATDCSRHCPRYSTRPRPLLGVSSCPALGSGRRKEPVSRTRRQSRRSWSQTASARRRSRRSRRFTTP